MLRKTSKVLLFSTALSTTYLIYLLASFSSFDLENENASAFMMILMAFLIPHVITVALAVLLAWVGVFTHKPTIALISTLLYFVAAALFLLYAIFLIPSIIFGFIGFFNQKKINDIEVY